jgi:hypothetical protein
MILTYWQPRVILTYWQPRMILTYWQPRMEQLEEGDCVDPTISVQGLPPLGVQDTTTNVASSSPSWPSVCYFKSDKGSVG